MRSLWLWSTSVNQSDSTEWLDERRLRLTASSFGTVCDRRENSRCGLVVLQLLNAKGNSAATRYIQAHEAEAIKSF